MGILFSRRTDSSRTRYRSHTDSASGFDYDDDERCTRVNRQPNYTTNNNNNNSKINKRVNRVTQQRRILSLPSFSFFTSRSRTNNNNTSPRFFNVGGGVNNNGGAGQPNTSPRSGRTGLFKKQYLIDNHYVYHQQSPLFSNESDLIEAYDGNNHENNHDYRHLSSSSTMTETTDRDSTVMTQRESFSSSLVPETMHSSSSAAAASSPHSSSSSLLLSSSGGDDNDCHDKRESSVIDANILRILGEEQKQLFHSNNSGDAASTKQHSSSFMRPVSNSFILSHQPCLSPRRPNKPAPPLPLYARVQNYAHKTDIS